MKVVVKHTAQTGWFFDIGSSFIIETESEWGALKLYFSSNRVIMPGCSKPSTVGIRVTAIGEAPSIEKAIDVFTTASDNFSALIALCSNTSYEVLEFELAGEIDEGNKKDTKLIIANKHEVFPLPFGRRYVPMNNIKNILKLIFEFEDSKRLKNAIAQYLEVLRSFSPGKEIMLLAHSWMATEALTKAFLKKDMKILNIDDTNEYAKFHGIERKDIDSFVRKKFIIKDIAVYKATKKASDGLEHGYLDLEEVNSLAHKVGLLAAQEVRLSIFNLIDVSDTDIKDLMMKDYITPFSCSFKKIVNVKIKGGLSLKQALTAITTYESVYKEKETTDDIEDALLTSNDKVTINAEDPIVMEIINGKIWSYNDEKKNNTKIDI